MTQMDSKGWKFVSNEYFWVIAVSAPFRDDDRETCQ